MIKYNLKALAGSIVLASMVLGAALPAYAQTSTTTTSTLNVQQRLALLETEVIVLFGRVVMNISAQASTTPALTGSINQLKQAWVGLALNHMSILRARFGL